MGDMHFCLRSDRLIARKILVIERSVSFSVALVLVWSSCEETIDHGQRSDPNLQVLSLVLERTSETGI